MKTFSWVLLTIIGLLGLLGSVESLHVAYFGDASGEIVAGSVTLADLTSDAQVLTAIKGRRGTAASLGVGFTLLLLVVVVGPYRRGAIWAWWAILAATVLFGVGVLLRIPTLGTTQGAATGLMVLLITIPALLLDVQRVARKTKAKPDTKTAAP